MVSKFSSVELGARDAAGEVGDIVAVAIGAPDIEEPGGGVMEGDVVAARCLLRRRPAPSRPTCRP